jgi:hypothetical protein
MIVVLAWLVFGALWLLCQLEPVADLGVPGVRLVSRVCGWLFIVTLLFVPAAFAMGVNMFSGWWVDQLQDRLPGVTPVSIPSTP